MIAEKLKAILDLIFADDIALEVTEADEIVTISAADPDLALIIGKAGRNAKALRELIYLYNKLHHTNYKLEITPTEGSVEANSTEETTSEETASDSDEASETEESAE